MGLRGSSPLPREGAQSLAQRYAKARKGMGLKIVGYAADSVLQMFVAQTNQEAKGRVLQF